MQSQVFGAQLDLTKDVLGVKQALWMMMMIVMRELGIVHHFSWKYCESSGRDAGGGYRFRIERSKIDHNIATILRSISWLRLVRKKTIHGCPYHDRLSRQSGILASDADYHAVVPGFECWRRYGFCKCIELLRYDWGTQNCRRSTSPLVRLVEGEERWEAPEHP
ncbi:hypothetical protein TNCV_1241771 [Trichonephila clavipes]|nr:hypothetical protein TNCV_1241771 [Trichonephila clavipes]